MAEEKEQLLEFHVGGSRCFISIVDLKDGWLRCRICEVGKDGHEKLKVQYTTVRGFIMWLTGI